MDAWEYNDMKLSFFSSARRTLLLLAVLMVPGLASAVPITYKFSGSAAGSFTPTGGSAAVFSDVALLVVINTDTSNINTTRFGAGKPATDTLVSGTLSLGGLGAGTFNELLYVFNNQGLEVVGFGNLGNNDLINITNATAGLDTYGLDTAFGPVTDASAFVSQFTSVGTSFGTVSLTGLRNASFVAITDNTPVPEPKSLALAMAGLVLMRVQRGRRRA